MQIQITGLPEDNDLPETASSAGEDPVERELERLDWQANILGPAENQIMIELGLPWAGKILEVGCGTGAVAKRLLSIRPQLEITGLDLASKDDSKAKRAIRRLNGGYESVNAVTDDFPGKDYDLTYTRFVLRHVANASAVVEKMREATRPGGRVVLIDSDDGGMILHPPVDGLSEAVAKTHQRVKENAIGAEPLMGRRLLQLAHDAGLADLTLRALLVTTAELSPSGFYELLLPFRTREINGLQAAENKSLEQALDDWTKKKGAFAMWPFMFVGGTVPDRGKP